MPEEKDLTGELVKRTKGVLEKAYDDLAHPTAKSIGNTLSLVPRTIGVWLGKWEKWIINGEESIRLTAQAVAEGASKIPPEKLTEPEPYVVVPAIQQLSYCYDSEELRKLYANLLVSSMNSDTKWKVHPSFSSIIQQLNPDEVKLLTHLNLEASKSIAIISVELEITGSRRGVVTPLKWFSHIYGQIMDIPDNYLVYIDNLMRLNLCDVPGTFLLDDKRYSQILQSESYVSNPYSTIVKQGSTKVTNEDAQVKGIVKKLSLDLTDLGKEFCEVCIRR